MAATATDQDPPQTSEGSDGGERPAWAEDLKSEILDAVKGLVAPLREGGTAQAAAQRHEEGKLGGEADLDAKITAAIEKVGKDRAAADQARSTEDRLAAVEAATAERPPVDRRSVHRLMGWGEPSQ